MQKRMLFIICLVFAIALINATQVFYQDFNVTSQPTGWEIRGYVGTSHTSDGTAKANSSLYPSDGTRHYLRLTEDSGYNRAWAYYTPTKFPRSWQMESHH